jgi:hypothetical protein
MKNPLFDSSHSHLVNVSLNFHRLKFGIRFEEQGDQIGRIFAYWALVNVYTVGIFSKITEAAKINWPIFATVCKSDVLICDKN